MHTFLFSCTYILQKKYSVSRQDNIMISYHIIVANVYRNTMPINPLQIPSKYKTHSLHFYVYTLIFSCIYALIFSNTYLMHTRCRKKFCRKKEAQKGKAPARPSPPDQPNQDQTLSGKTRSPGAAHTALASTLNV